MSALIQPETKPSFLCGTDWAAFEEGRNTPHPADGSRGPHINPYPKDTEKWYSWNKGWSQGWDDVEAAEEPYNK